MSAVGLEGGIEHSISLTRHTNYHQYKYDKITYEMFMHENVTDFGPYKITFLRIFYKDTYSRVW